MGTPGLLVARLSVLVAAAILISACSSSAPAAGGASGGAPAAGSAQPAASGQTAAGKIKRGGTLTFSQPGSFAGADPAMGQNAYQLWQFVGTYMVRRAPDTWKIEGDAIEKWAFSPDGKELTLNVRKGVKWENKPPVNGRDVDAKDIVYTLKSITGMQYPDMPALRFPRKANLDDMVDAVAVDQYTVKVTLKQPSPSFLDGMAEYRSPITPDQVREHFGGRDALANPSAERYLSAGPFVISKYIDLQEAVYERYPNYWEKGEDGQSKPYLDKVRSIWIGDTGTSTAAFIAGQVDYIGLGNPETRKQVIDSRKDTQVILSAPPTCWNFMTFNTTRKPLDDVRVRKAMSILIDQKELGQALYGEFNGQQIWRYNGPLAHSYPQAIPQEELAKLKHYESPKSQATIDEAKKLMAEAGVDKLNLNVITITGGLNDAAQLYYAQIKKHLPNVTFTIQPLDNAIQLERAVKGDFDIQNYCNIHEPTPQAMLRTIYHSKGGRNMSRVNDAKMDELVDKASVELDEGKRNALLREAQNRALELYTTFPTIHYVTVHGVPPYLRGFRGGGGTVWNMYAKEIWYDK